MICWMRWMLEAKVAMMILPVARHLATRLFKGFAGRHAALRGGACPGVSALVESSSSASDTLVAQLAEAGQVDHLARRWGRKSILKSPVCTMTSPPGCGWPARTASGDGVVDTDELHSTSSPALHAGRPALPPRRACTLFDQAVLLAACPRPGPRVSRVP